MQNLKINLFFMGISLDTFIWKYHWFLWVSHTFMEVFQADILDLGFDETTTIMQSRMK